MEVSMCPSFMPGDSANGWYIEATEGEVMLLASVRVLLPVLLLLIGIRYLLLLVLPLRDGRHIAQNQNPRN